MRYSIPDQTVNAVATHIRAMPPGIFRINIVSAAIWKTVLIFPPRDAAEEKSREEQDCERGPWEQGEAPDEIREKEKEGRQDVELCKAEIVLETRLSP